MTIRKACFLNFIYNMSCLLKFESTITVQVFFILNFKQTGTIISAER